ncbi:MULTISPECIES: lysophospholipid acyltransferase family protein [Hydrocarboniphaga]|uniref:lysophospholipid acyltransferase family protein n=1 Tax=Hydrocarboniphaga TaxID=243627 RepID=UPI000683FFFF|nr:MULTISPECIES: lysophospholipid acyltransferase family protein [Hydrocarboniphaga]MDZ4078074.1 lysophospholipid acyltransferase family protein [Hydrocarboniphaga sp.]
MAQVLLALRCVRLVAHLLLGMLLVGAVGLARGRIRPEPLTQWWNQRLFTIFDLRIRIHGQPVDAGHLTVSNHVSWLDICLIASCERTRFVSKSEVRHWPIVGSLATAAGTFYLKRGRGGSRPLITQLVPYLQGGGSLTLFPEGTTTTGESVLPFHSRLFAAAIESNRPVQPVAIRYGLAADGRNIAPYVGEDVLFDNIVELLRNPGLEADVFYLPAIPAGALERDGLAAATRTVIEKALLAPASAKPQVALGRRLAA